MFPTQGDTSDALQPVQLTRREAVRAGIGAGAALLGFGARGAHAPSTADEPAATPASITSTPRPPMIACFIRYQIDPFQREAFKEYATTWGRIIPRAGGHLIGYFLPHEGTNDVGWGLIAFDSLAAYERYRAVLRSDAAAKENFLYAQRQRFILREERTFVEVVDGTFELSPVSAGPG